MSLNAAKLSTLKDKHDAQEAELEVAVVGARVVAHSVRKEVKPKK